MIFHHLITIRKPLLAIFFILLILGNNLLAKLILLVFCCFLIVLPTSKTFVLLPTDELDIVALIKNLRYDCAVGFDGISGALLKGSKRRSNITFICNLTFSTCVFPDTFKLTQVIPTYKKRDKNCVTEKKNYVLLIHILASTMVFATNDSVQQVTNFILTNIDEK